MFENLSIQRDTTQAQGAEADFQRGLFLSEKMGQEFNGIGRSGVIAQLIISQGFAVLFLVPVVLFYIVRNLLKGPFWIAITIAAVAGATLIIGGIIAMVRINGTGSSSFNIRSTTDSRYRIRAIVPKRRQSYGFRQWAEVTLNVKPKEPEPEKIVEPQNLDAERGGFEPIILRPWFGISRPRAFWWTAIVCGIVGVSTLLYLLHFIVGGWSTMFQNTGFLAYAATGFAMVSGALGAELIFPVYIRVVPGRLDIFRYGFLGSGKPQVETYDLRTIGLCVDFGSYSVALEPARPPGEPLPEFVAAKRWPHAKTHPDGHSPDYFTLALCPGRLEYCQRIIQAARTDEATPDLPDDELLG